MTDHVNLPLTDIDDNSPASADVFHRLRDNPIAAVEGSAGAPQLATDAVATGAINSGKTEPSIRQSRLLSGACRFRLVTSVLTIQHSFNMASITETGVGHYDFAFIFWLSLSDYFVTQGGYHDADLNEFDKTEYRYLTLDKDKDKNGAGFSMVNYRARVNSHQIPGNAKSMSIQVHNNYKAP